MFTIHIKKSWVFGFISFILGSVFTIVVSLSTSPANAESKQSQPVGKYVVFCDGNTLDTMSFLNRAKGLTDFYNEDVPNGLKYVGPITGVKGHCALFER